MKLEFKSKNILLISPEPWNHIFVSKHHYAVELSKRGNVVFFLNPPAGKFLIETTNFKNIFSLSYTGFIIGFRFFPSVLRRFCISSMIIRLEKIAGVKFNIVWSFDNSVFFDFRAFGKDVYKIAHIVDLNQAFEFKISAKTADLCISTNRFVINKFKKYNNETYFINHGLFTLKNKNKSLKKYFFPGANRIKVCYAGNLDIVYFDWYLLETIVNENPQVDFVLAGPWRNDKKISHFSQRRNFYHIGILSSQDLQEFYAHADLLIICYMADKFRRQLANPHKMIEYLGSGKMICSTFTKEYEAIAKDGFFLMSDGNASYPDLFKNCIYDLEHWNREELQTKRIAFAQEHTYDKQINRIETKANSHS